MKQTVTATTLMPKYFSRFECLGGDVEGTRRAGWSITGDRATFRSCQARIEPEPRRLFSKHAKRDPGAKELSSDGGPKYMDDALVFLRKAKRCLLQERMEKRICSSTCTRYPYKIHSFGDLSLMTLKLSRPEAVRLALLAEDAFDLASQDPSMRTRQPATENGSGK